MGPTVLPLVFTPALPDGRAPRVLCLGAHSDDIEIGCAGTLMAWAAGQPRIELTCVVMSAIGPRAVEARRSLKRLLPGVEPKLVLGDFDDATLPADFVRAKQFLAEVRDSFEPDLVFTHRLEDRHQDHRALAELTWQLWRNHLVLEYEIPKYEGDLGQPNVYVALTADIARRKCRHLMKHFGTQRSKGWFNEDVFRALMLLRGVECRAESGLAEAFHVRKAVWRPG